MPLALYVKAELGLDYAFANQVKIMGLFSGSIFIHTLKRHRGLCSSKYLGMERH